MVTRIQANAAMKAEMKSFEMCVTMLISMASLPDVKKYLAEREITVAYLKQKSAAKTLVCKAQLMNYCTLYEFTAKNGSTYKASVVRINRVKSWKLIGLFGVYCVLSTRCIWQSKKLRL